MRLVINGDECVVPEGLSFQALLVHLRLTEGPVAIERNGEIVPRREHGSTAVAEGDVLEIVHFVGGGLRSEKRRRILDGWPAAKRLSRGRSTLHHLTPSQPMPPRMVEP